MLPHVPHGTKPPQTGRVDDLAGTCPVCKAEPGKVCRALDFLPLPGGHPERSTATPAYDALAAEFGATS